MVLSFRRYTFWIAKTIEQHSDRLWDMARERSRPRRSSDHLYREHKCRQDRRPHALFRHACETVFVRLFVRSKSHAHTLHNSQRAASFLLRRALSLGLWHLRLRGSIVKTCLFSNEITFAVLRHATLVVNDYMSAVS